MGVRIKKRGGKWYVYVDYHGRRKNRAVGSKEAADRVRREIEARRALGDLTFLDRGCKPVPLLCRAVASELCRCGMQALHEAQL